MARKKFSATFKAQVALEVIKNETTLAEISKKHDVHPTQIKLWKTELLARANTIFETKGVKEDHKGEYIEALERKAGQQVIEIDFLKKNLTRYHDKSESK